MHARRAGRRATAPRLVEVRALQRAVAVDVRVDEGRTPRSASCRRTASGVERLRRSVQPRGRDAAAAHVDADGDPVAVLGDQRRRARRVAERGRADHDPAGARVERRVRGRAPSAARRRTAPGRRSSRGDPLEMRRGSPGAPSARRRGRRRAAARALPRPSAARPPADRSRTRSCGVEVALREAHGLAVEDVDGRIELRARVKPRAPTAAQMPAKFAQQPQPVGARLLGVELDAVERLALDRADERARRSRRCRARRRRPAATGANECTK